MVLLEPDTGLPAPDIIVMLEMLPSESMTVWVTPSSPTFTLPRELNKIQKKFMKHCNSRVLF